MMPHAQDLSTRCSEGGQPVRNGSIQVMVLGISWICRADAEECNLKGASNLAMIIGLCTLLSTFFFYGLHFEFIA